MTSKISKLARKLAREPDVKDSLFNTCTVCKNLCQSSKLLNDVDFCTLLRTTGEEAFGDAYSWQPLQRDKLPDYFVGRINDCNQWNEFETYVFEQGEFPHHLSVEALELSVKEKCHLCSLLWSHFSVMRYGIMEQEVDVDVASQMDNSRQVARALVRAAAGPLFARVGIKIGSQGGCIAIVLYNGHQKEKLPDVRSALGVWRTKGVSSVTKIPLEDMKGDLPADCNSLFQTSTASKDTIHLIKEWMKCCQGKKHFLCKLEHEGLDDLPRRLLDVSHRKPRLYFPSVKDKGKLKYLCLSHCWGKGGVFKLTVATLPGLLRGIDFSQLPRTFQDAVDITRRLNYSYIWIDSLCIQQDSNDDWVDQAAKMTSIYMNADLTLAALASTDSTGGMYSHDRNMQTYWPCILPTKLPLTAWYGRIWPFHNERLTTAPLLSRGWVLQERCLGPRMVYFGKFGVYWECATMRADEVFTAGFASDSLGPTGDDLATGEILAKALLNRRLRLVGSDGVGFPLYLKVTDVDPFPHRIFAKFIGYWYQIVEVYTSAHLTFGRDKLVAISGLVKLIQKRTGLTPFAGLWLEYLLDDMLWKTVRPELISRPAEYQAPSFSWASLNGPVKRKVDLLGCSNQSGYQERVWEPHEDRGYQRRYLAELVAHEIEGMGPGRHPSEVKSAKIELLCLPKKVTVTHKGKSGEGDGWSGRFQNIWTYPHDNKPSGKGLVKKRSGDGDVVGADSDDEKEEAKSPSPMSPYWFGIDCASDVEPTGTLTVTCVPLIEWYHPSAEESKGDPSRSFRHVAGIALVPSQAREGNDALETYRRIGVFEDCWRGEQERWRQGDTKRIAIV